MKKILSIIICIFLMLPIITAAAEESDVKTLGVLSYKVENGAVTITDCDANATGVIEIPAEIDGLPVTTIGNHAFSGCKFIENIIIPNKKDSSSILYGAFIGAEFTRLEVYYCGNNTIREFECQKNKYHN